MNDCNIFGIFDTEILCELLLQEIELHRNLIAVRLNFDEFVRDDISFFICLRLKERNIIENRIVFMISRCRLITLLRSDFFRLIVQSFEVCIKRVRVLVTCNFLNGENGVVRNCGRIFHHGSSDKSSGGIFMDIFRLLVLHRIVQQNLRIRLHVLETKFSHLLSVYDRIIIFVCFYVIPIRCSLNKYSGGNVSLDRRNAQVQLLFKCRNRQSAEAVADFFILVAGDSSHCNRE